MRAGGNGREDAYVVSLRAHTSHVTRICFRQPGWCNKNAPPAPCAGRQLQNQLHLHSHDTAPLVHTPLAAPLSTTDVAAQPTHPHCLDIQTPTGGWPTPPRAHQEPAQHESAAAAIMLSLRAAPQQLGVPAAARRCRCAPAAAPARKSRHRALRPRQGMAVRYKGAADTEEALRFERLPYDCTEVSVGPKAAIPVGAGATDCHTHGPWVMPLILLPCRPLNPQPCCNRPPLPFRPVSCSTCTASPPSCCATSPRRTTPCAACRSSRATAPPLWRAATRCWRTPRTWRWMQRAPSHPGAPRASTCPCTCCPARSRCWHRCVVRARRTAPVFSAPPEQHCIRIPAVPARVRGAEGNPCVVLAPRPPTPTRLAPHKQTHAAGAKRERV